MNNTGEQVADDNRKKDYTSAGSATHSLYCRLPLPPPRQNGPDDTYNPCPHYRNHFHEDCTLHTCSTEAVRTVEKIVNPRHSHLQRVLFIGHVSTYHLQDKGIHFICLLLRAMQSRLVNGSYLAILHHTVHGAMRIESRNIQVRQYSHRCRHSPEIIVLIGRTMLTDASGTIFCCRLENVFPKRKSVLSTSPCPKLRR